jgi:hypothetical protein
MCQKCDEKLSQFGSDAEERTNTLATVMTEGYNAGVDVLMLLQENQKMGNSAIKVFIDQVLELKEKAAVDIMLSGAPVGEIADEMVQLERESLIIAMFATAKMIEKNFPLEVWECDNLDDTGVLPCGHTVDQHVEIDERRRKAGLS